MPNYLHGVQYQHFNPRTREGCDKATELYDFIETNFNPRTREGCDIVFDLTSRCKIIFQSTHPRRVRRKGLSEGLKDLQISIHAPAKGATNTSLMTSAYPLISIHAPAKGATKDWLHWQKIMQNFNPRTREGCDKFSCLAKGNATNISIHAPAKGATW